MLYQDLLLAFALDLAAITVLVVGVYLPRHQRRDLILPFVGVNVGLFAVAAFVADQEVNLAFGLGLFALLSVVRLRSSEIAQEDIAYYFMALVLGLINGFARSEQWPQVVTFDAILICTMYLADHPRLLGDHIRHVVTLDKVYRDERALRQAIEEHLGGTVTKTVVREIDLAHDRMVVDVNLRRPARRHHRDRQ